MNDEEFCVFSVAVQYDVAFDEKGSMPESVVLVSRYVSKFHRVYTFLFFKFALSFPINKFHQKIVQRISIHLLYLMHLMKESVLSFEEKTTQPWITYFQITGKY